MHRGRDHRAIPTRTHVRHQYRLPGIVIDGRRGLAVAGKADWPAAGAAARMTGVIGCGPEGATLGA